MNVRRVVLPAMMLVSTACGGSEGPSGDDVLATAAGYEFDAEAAARIMAPQTQFPPEAVEALADLWTQYFLLARAAAIDTSLANIDLSPLVERQLEGELVVGLRDEVIQVDTAMSEQELRARFEADLPGGRIRARHILLQYPEGGTEAQADSVRAMAESLRSRILNGEDFEALAREFSQDTQTAVRGGDLGSFGRNETFPQFEAAAFGLDVGEVSGPVETTLGVHLIRLDEKILPNFDEMQEQYRAQIQGQMVAQAESTYVANLVEAAEMESDTTNFESVRRLAADVALDLSPRALDRTLVRYNGGELTLGDYRKWLLMSPSNVPPQIQSATNDQLATLLEGLTRSELLVN
ncbi:MAG: peptidylprolyl isomerase, partial [Gemmatimonadota bacterium]